MKEVNYKEKGITLVALVVTIIILLILATIVIAGIINSRMIERSKEAAELHKIEQYREAIELVRPELDIERSEGKTLQTSEEYLTKFKDKIKEQELFKDARRVDLVQNGTTKEDEIIVETKEGYVYRVTEDGTEYLGKTGENLPPSLADGDIGANINPDGWTNQDVKVTLYITEKGKSKLEEL